MKHDNTYIHNFPPAAVARAGETPRVRMDGWEDHTGHGGDM